MQKIKTLFVRDPDDRRHVLPEVTPGCEWVLAGEGAPTRKWDGTCVLLDGHGSWWARREVKAGKTPPPSYRPLSTDPVTGKTVGWEPVGQSGYARYHAEALTHSPAAARPGTYELVGPRVNGNPEGFAGHMLLAHGWAPFSDRRALDTAPRDYDGLRAWLLATPGWEGIVWHRDPGSPDSDMVKIKAKDFR